jgi:hypothetical protein
MAGIKDYSTTATSNTEVGGISIQEGMLPSSLNNAIRAILVDVREWYNDSQWIVYGDGDSAFTIAYASATTFTIAGVNVTGFYHVGRRVKAVGSSTGTIYGTISATAFSTNTTVTVVWDSGSLQNETLTVSIGALSATNNTIPGTSIATTNLIDASVTLAKLASDSVNGTKIADNSINSEHYVDASIDTAHIADAQITADKIASNAVTTAKINADAITGAKIADDAINSEHYTDASIDTAHIADSQVTTAKLASNAITTVKITDGNVTLAKLAADSVNGSKIVDDSIDSEHYADGSIDTAHIADDQITTAKIADSQITSAKITDGAIVNADINASAAIAATKIHNGSISNTEFGYLNGVSSAIQTQMDAKAATSYVNDAVAGLRTRIIAECASTANVNISNALEAGDTIDGITLVTGDRVLLKDQSTASENGLYLAVASSAGAASRDPQFNSIEELSGQMIVVNQGSANDNKIFLCTTNNTASLGSDSITYNVITPSNVGTVTSIGIADSGAGEFTVGNSPITSNGNITLAVNSIADTKLGTIATANKVSLTALNINGGTDIGADLTTSDLIAVDDGAGGTNRKAALSRVITLVQANIDDPTALAIALG